MCLLSPIITHQAPFVNYSNLCRVFFCWLTYFRIVCTLLHELSFSASEWIPTRNLRKEYTDATIRVQRDMFLIWLQSYLCWWGTFYSNSKSHYIQLVHFTFQLAWHRRSVDLNLGTHWECVRFSPKITPDTVPAYLWFCFLCNLPWWSEVPSILQNSQEVSLIYSQKRYLINFSSIQRVNMYMNGFPEDHSS